MWISTRKKFQVGSDGWSDYVSFIGLPKLREIRTLDTNLNEVVEGGNLCQCNWDDIHRILQDLPVPIDDNEYYLLAVDMDSDVCPSSSEEWCLLGYDLCDDSFTSSLLNCGPWEGELKPFTRNLNAFGLLDKKSAEEAKQLLPLEWGRKEPHTHVAVYGLFEWKT